MANAGRRGRPIAPLVLSAEERAYLERQVRRHRVARSLSERCRVILRCADRLASKDVAAELERSAALTSVPMFTTARAAALPAYRACGLAVA